MNGKPCTTHGSTPARGKEGPGRRRAGAAAGRPRSEAGMSLAEVIVAAALALIGFLIALVLYQAARQAFKKGEQATDQQQEIRVAYDRMLKDLRLAGYNWDASGEDRPGEEQIEGAWSGAVTIRGDYDFEDTTLAADPEDVIKGTTNKATVGNDEIVTFCLRKPTGTGGTTVTFNADVHSSTTATSTLYGTVSERDGVTEAVSVPGVYLTQTDPPYNLYRVSLNNTRSTYGGASFVQYQLLAENVKSLAFTYLDAQGNAITPPGGAETGTPDPKTERAKIRKITVTVVGMTAVADNNYTDPTDANAASQHFRKFTLTTQVTPRNLGFKGRADTDLTAPSVPTGLTLCPGHCAAMLVKWNANPTTEGVAQYEMKYGTSPASMLSTTSTGLTTAYVTPLTAGTTYYFAIRASDAGGNHSAYTTTVSGVVNDVTYPDHTVPAQVTSFVGTGHGGGAPAAVANRVDLTWNAVTANAVNLACDTTTAIRDLSGYRLYRSPTSSYTPGSATLVAAEPTYTPPGPPQIGGSTATYSDTSVVNCRDYYYFLNGVDTTSCANQSANFGSSYKGKASSTVLPAAPTSVASTRTGSNSAHVTWTATTQDTSTPTPAAITIDTYKVYRCQINNAADPEAATYTFIGTSTPPNVYYDDLAAPSDIGGKTVYYKVAAVDDCPNESAKSSASSLLCAFNGLVSIAPPDSPPAPSLTLAQQIVTVTASGTDTFTSATLRIDKVGGTNDYNVGQVLTGNTWTFTWTPGQGAGSYIATAVVTNSNSCTGLDTATWTVAVSACDTCINVPKLDPTVGAGGSYNLQANVITNNCFFPLQLTQVQVREKNPSTCTNNSCSNNYPLKLLKVQYRSSGSFASESSDVVYTAGGTGDNVSTSATATVDLTSCTTCQVDANSSAGIVRLVFSSATPIWVANQANKRHTLEGKFSFTQTSSLCTPSSTPFLQLSIETR